MVPKINTEYTNYKSNTAGLIILAIFGDGTETDAQAKDWDTKNKVAYPSIGPSAGAKISKDYSFPGFPTLILIAPGSAPPYKVVEKNLNYNSLSATFKKYPISTDITGIVDNPVVFDLSGLKLAQVSQNKFSLNMPVPGNYSFALFSMNGSLIKALPNSFFRAGNNTISLTTGNEQSQGTYIYTIKNSQQSFTGKVTVK